MRGNNYFRVYPKFNIGCVILILSIFFTKLVQAQSVYIAGYGSSNFSTNFRTFTQNHTNKTQQGSKYLSEEWMVGRLVLKDGTAIKSLFRYNVVEQNIELVVNTDTLIFVKSFDLGYFEFLGKRFIYDVVIEKDFTGKYLAGAYLEELVDGKCKLYRKYDKGLISFSQGYKYAAAEASIESYQLQTSLYIKCNKEDAPIIFPKSKKKILELFADKKDDVRKLINENNLKFLSDDDYIQLVNNYNSL